jgi:hypothetical protein
VTAGGKQRARRYAAQDGELSILGLRPGDRVRWRPVGGGRWRHGDVWGRERDGSIGVTEDGGGARSLRVEHLEVRTEGARGGERWEAVTVRAARAEQLAFDLFG